MADLSVDDVLAMMDDDDEDDGEDLFLPEEEAVAVKDEPLLLLWSLSVSFLIANVL